MLMLDGPDFLLCAEDYRSVFFPLLLVGFLKYSVELTQGELGSSDGIGDRS